MQGVAQQTEVGRVELLHLVRRVAPGEVRPEGVALDRVGQNDGRLALVGRRGAVGGIDLVIVVSAAFERPNLIVGPVRDHRLGPRIAAEERIAHERAVVGPEPLVVAVAHLVHEIDEGAFLVGLEQHVPFAAPDDLDDVPACALKKASSSWMIFPLPRTGPSSAGGCNRPRRSDCQAAESPQAGAGRATRVRPFRRRPGSTTRAGRSCP